MPSKVSIVRCRDYETSRIYAAVKRSVDLIGGIERFVQPGQRVLLKPNLLKAASPEEAVTTHPEFVRAAARLIKGRGARVLLGDSPGGLVKAETVYARSGIGDVCREEKIELIKFDSFTRVNGIPLAKIIEEVDVIVSLPKFKTHNLTVITAAVKNVFGLIPGLYKVQCHKEAPNFKVFSARLAAIFGLVRPQLNILDSVWAMEGDGPSAGEKKELGLVLASADAVAMDATISRIIGLDPQKVISTREARRLQLGQSDPDQIEITGESIESVGVRDFKLPKIVSLYRVPNFISRLLIKIVPLVMGIDSRLCSGCGMCKDICPQQTIKKIGGKLKIDFHDCILCLCCSEICPQRAIYLRFFNRRPKS